MYDSQTKIIELILRLLEAIGGHRRPLDATGGQLRILEIKYRTCTFIRYLRVLLQGFSSITNEAKLCFFHRSYYANIKLFFFEYASEF